MYTEIKTQENITSDVVNKNSSLPDAIADATPKSKGTVVDCLPNVSVEDYKWIEVEI